MQRSKSRILITEIRFSINGEWEEVYDRNYDPSKKIQTCAVDRVVTKGRSGHKIRYEEQVVPVSPIAPAITLAYNPSWAPRWETTVYILMIPKPHSADYAFSLAAWKRFCYKGKHTVVVATTKEKLIDLYFLAVAGIGNKIGEQ